jgi:hypothetical protein
MVPKCGLNAPFADIAIVWAKMKKEEFSLVTWRFYYRKLITNGRFVGLTWR